MTSSAWFTMGIAVQLHSVASGKTCLDMLLM
jgi:hypothetical protein